MFDIVGNKVQLSANALAIPPFKKYYEERKDKALACKEIEYIVWKCKWNSPYKAYPKKDREFFIKKDVFNDSAYVPSKELEDLEIRFLEFQNTQLIRLYNAAEDGVEFLIDTLENIRQDAFDSNLDLESKLKVTANVARILKDIEPTSKSLISAKERVMLEQAESGKITGGGTIGLYEVPKK